MYSHLTYDSSSIPQWKKNSSKKDQTTKRSSKYPPITHIQDEYIKDESGKMGGEDIERVDLSDMKLLPHRLIGAIICKGPANTLQTGTGILVSKNIVLTCAHVINNW